MKKINCYYLVKNIYFIRKNIEEVKLIECITRYKRLLYKSYSFV